MGSFSIWHWAIVFLIVVVPALIGLAGLLSYRVYRKKHPKKADE